MSQRSLFDSCPFLRLCKTPLQMEHHSIPCMGCEQTVCLCHSFPGSFLACMRNLGSLILKGLLSLKEGKRMDLGVGRAELTPVTLDSHSPTSSLSCSTKMRHTADDARVRREHCSAGLRSGILEHVVNLSVVHCPSLEAQFQNWGSRVY